MRDVTEAHFLHQRSGLEPVLRPPVSNPTALAWVPGREELIVCTREGVIHAVDPVLGTRNIQTGLGEAAVLSLHPDRKRWLVISREGEWIAGKLTGGVEYRGRHPFVGGMEGFWLGEYMVIAGDEMTGRTLIILQAGDEKARMWLPPRVIPVQAEDGKLNLARSTPAGLEVIKAGREVKFPPGETTAHLLRPSGKFVLGFTPTGVAIWDRKGGTARSMRLPDLTSGDINADGDFIGLGTRTGAVALAALGKVDARAKPHLVKAFEQPVRAVAFSDRGTWLATGAEGLQIWTWEE